MVAAALVRAGGHRFRRSTRRPEWPARRPGGRRAAHHAGLRAVQPDAGRLYPAAGLANRRDRCVDARDLAAAGGGGIAGPTADTALAAPPPGHHRAVWHALGGRLRRLL